MATRLEHLLKRFEKIRHPGDVAELKAQIPELVGLSDWQVQKLWSDWSEDYFCARWMILSEWLMEEFRRYLLDDVDECGAW